MNPFRQGLTGVLLAALTSLLPRIASAVDRDCPGLTVEADAPFQHSFPDALTRIQSALSARPDVDACAHVELGVDGNARITLLVTLFDGRAAARTVKRRDDVLPALQALLLVPEPPSVAPAAVPPLPPASARGKAESESVASAQPARRSSAARRADTPRDADPVQHAIRAPRQLGIELSLLVGGRIGTDAQLAFGVGALSFIELHGWLLGFEGRADAYRTILESDPETAVELAILAGRRFDLGGVALDLTAGPGIAMKGLTFSDTAPVNPMTPAHVPPPQQPDRSSGPVPRLLLGARFGFNPRSAFRTFVGIDAELGPKRAASSATPPSTQLPGFSLGLAVGVTVGTP